ncbi:efflux RND transporter periplasmic adaptor subunit [uncultured Rhodoblastus sp.]|uniref:efflux RND transporter periplasmic adaptor subunit n=1 Tax=uncultured Rhodoblastus sp. TaxID=543037 RepID=UPI0025E1E203|nr:efflux RND transporter periplasmic adaptor subunit [uncultured Rhodoblastus sp.]
MTTTVSCFEWRLGHALERFPAKWIQVRVKKTRKSKKLEPRSDSIGSDKALAGIFFVALATCNSSVRAATFDCVLEPSLTVKLGSPVSSLLADVQAERGDVVKRGQVIAHVESAVEEAAVLFNRARAESTAEIEAKQAILAQKTGIINRKRGLQESHVGSPQDVENAQADFNVAKQEVALAVLNKRMAEIDLQRSKAMLDQRTIRSPIDGVVTQRNLGPGEYVNQESNIVSVARIDPLNAETYLPVRYYGEVKIGDKAKVRPNDPVGGDRDAEVSVVDQVFDAASGTFGVRLRLANSDYTVPAGLRCRVTFSIPEKPASRDASAERTTP